MSHLGGLVVVLVVAAGAACGRAPLGLADASGGSTGGGAIAGAGGVIAGGGGTSAGGAIAGAGGTSAGGAIAGSGGAGGSAIGGSAGGAIGGTGGGDDLGPIRLVIFYTRWGTNYPDWWPIGGERDFTFNPMMQPLEPHKSELIFLSGITNASLYPGDGGTTLKAAQSVGGPEDSMTTLLTARPAAGKDVAQGPSLDTAVGDCGGAAGPPLRLTVGTFGWTDMSSISYGADGLPIRGERDPNAVATRVLGHGVDAPDPDGPPGAIDTTYPALGAAHMDVAVEALATRKTCAVTLMWGDQVEPRWVGISDYVHDLSHTGNSVYLAVTTPTFYKPQDTLKGYPKVLEWYAQQFARLLDRMRAVPLGNGRLLDRSVVIWISDNGSGPDHSGDFLPIVIAGRAGGRLDVQRYLDFAPRPIPWSDVYIPRRTQGDLLAALASLWGIGTFGDPAITRQPMTEIFKP